MCLLRRSCNVPGDSTTSSKLRRPAIRTRPLLQEARRRNGNSLQSQNEIRPPGGRRGTSSTSGEALTARSSSTESSKADLLREHAYKVALGWAATLLAVATVFYHFVESWTWVDAFYFSSVAITTVGFGDLSPHHGCLQTVHSLLHLRGPFSVRSGAQRGLRRRDPPRPHT